MRSYLTKVICRRPLRAQEESEDSSDEDYRPDDGVLDPHYFKTDDYDSEHESSLDSVKKIQKLVVLRQSLTWINLQIQNLQK